MGARGDVSGKTIAMPALAAWLKNPPFSEQLSAVQVNPANSTSISDQKGVTTQIEQYWDLFRGTAERRRGKKDVEVCGEFEDFGVMCDFK